MDVDDFAPRLSFFFNAHIDFFEEIAKYRAARRIWARELRDTFGAREPESWRMRFHTQTAGVSLTAQQPLNNIVRTAIEALAGVLGGTQSLHTNRFDEALALPTEEAVRVALRTQQIIAEETGVANTIDPLGGSYFVEALTDRMEEQALRVLRQDRRARAAWSQAVKHGLPAARDRRRGLPLPAGARGRRAQVVVGVNAYTEGDDLQARRSCGSTRRSRSSRSHGCRRSGRGAIPARGARLERVDRGRARPGREPDAAAARGGAGRRPPRARSSPQLQTVFGSYREAPVF